MCVYSVYVLCIYKDTDIQHIFLDLFTWIYLYSYNVYIDLFVFIYLIFNVTYFFLNTVHACVCIYIYLINIHSTHIYTQPIKCFGSVSLYFLCLSQLINQ